MDPRQTQEVLLALSANYREELSPDQIGLWGSQLAPLDAGWAAAAAEKHMQHSKWFPTLAEFLDAYDSVRAAVQKTERELGTPTRCPGCFDQDTPGWVVVDAAGHGTVKRCAACNPPKPAGEHPRDCSCMVCHYGHDGAARIRAGFASPVRPGARPPLTDNRYRVEF